MNFCIFIEQRQSEIKASLKYIRNIIIKGTGCSSVYFRCYLITSLAFGLGELTVCEVNGFQFFFCLSGMVILTQARNGYLLAYLAQNKIICLWTYNIPTLQITAVLMSYLPCTDIASFWEFSFTAHLLVKPHILCMGQILLNVRSFTN